MKTEEQIRQQIKDLKLHIASLKVGTQENGIVLDASDVKALTGRNRGSIKALYWVLGENEPKETR